MGTCLNTLVNPEIWINRKLALLIKGRLARTSLLFTAVWGGDPITLEAH